MSHNPQVYKRLKAKTRDLIADCGGHERAASMTRVGASALYNYGNVNSDDAYLPADVLMDLEAECGVPHISRVLCEVTGYIPILIKSPQHAHDISISISRIAKEYSDVFDKTARALRDGKLDPDEAIEVLKEVDDSIVVLASFKAELTKIAGMRRDAFSQSCIERRPDLGGAL